MNKSHKIVALLICSVITSCKVLAPVEKVEKPILPESYSVSKDSINSAKTVWKDFFADKNLNALIEIGLKNNFDLQSALQNIEIARNDVRFKKGLLLPTVSVFSGAGIEKVGKYTSQGAGDASTEIIPGQIVPENLANLALGLNASWEVDIWKKLRNGKKAAFSRYLSTIEGKNFVITNLISEIANSYFMLLSLDNQLDVIRETIVLQQNAYEIVKAQKEAAKETELGVKRFEAEVLKSRSLEFDILQQITENENKINFLLARFPQPIIRNKADFMKSVPKVIQAGIPSQLLANRPDIKQAELILFATKCDVKSAQAQFYPSFVITSSVGFSAFKPSLFISPESLAYNLIGSLVAPLINRSAIKAVFNQSKAVQIQALIGYQQAVLNGYVEVANEMSKVNNLEKLFEIKNKQVTVLNDAISVSTDLFRSAKADYFEVLMTQRDALETKLDLIDTKNRQFNAMLNLYKSLGGGWK